MEKLEAMYKQTEQIANEAEAKYEEVKYQIITRLGVVVYVIPASGSNLEYVGEKETLITFLKILYLSLMQNGE